MDESCQALERTRINSYAVVVTEVECELHEVLADFLPPATDKRGEFGGARRVHSIDAGNAE